MYPVAIINQKGGCGKTTTAVNLSAALVEIGKRVLLIDLDPQAHATIHLSLNPEEVETNAYDFLKYAGKDDFFTKDVVYEISENFSLIPSHLVLSVFEQAFSGMDDHEYRLKDGLSSFEDVFDYVIIDCPPSLGLLTFNALMAARHVIVPVEPSRFALQGISRLKDTISLIEEKTGHDLIVKALVTLYDRRTRFADFMAQQVRETFPHNTFETIIRRTVRLKESAFYGKTINDYDRRSTGYDDYLSLAKEMVASSEKLKPEEFHDAVKGLAEQFNVEAEESSVEVPFVYRNAAASDIRIAGDFNDWNPDDSTRLEKDDSGTWKKVLRLSPGQYQYRLFIDGQWAEDDNNPKKIKCPFGGYNSILEISTGSN
ncbi:MAG: AAA family ATPase [Candidatus Aureabacteria bacterium]|nr:AAA family ATPase [Candidatus Auribacterota bacterium]